MIEEIDSGLEDTFESLDLVAWVEIVADRFPCRDCSFVVADPDTSEIAAVELGCLVVMAVEYMSEMDQ